MEATRVEELLQGPVQLTEQIRRAVEQADSFKQECENLHKQVDTLGQLLRTAARYASNGSGGLYERPTTRIMLEVEKVLEKALALVKKCKRSGILKRVITITSATDFRKVTSNIESSIGDLKWLLNVSASAEDRADFTGLPPIVATDPMLAMIWDQVSTVQSGTPQARADAALYLAIFARDSDRNGKIIIEEGGLPPLLKLLRDGSVEGQEAAAKALGVLATDEQRVLEFVREGAITVMLQVLGNAPMKVQAMVAFAVAQMADHSPDAQNGFASNGAIRLLVAILAHDTVEEPSRIGSLVSIHTVASTLTKRGGREERMDGWSEQGNGLTASPHKFMKPGGLGGPLVAPHVRVSTEDGVDDLKPGSSSSQAKSRRTLNENGNSSHARQGSRKEREKEDPEVRNMVKAEAAHALWKLACRNVKNCKSITDTRALLCFAKLIEQGEAKVQANSIMAVMEISIAAEQDQELKRAAFKINSPAAKAVVQQLLRVIDEGEPELQVPCLRSIGCLARIFPATTPVIKPLAAQLHSRDPSVAAAAAAAAIKFVDEENYLKLEHAKSIIENQGVPPLVQYVNFGDPEGQLHALKLLCYLAIHAGDNELLGGALPALEKASRDPSLKLQEPTIRMLLADAIQRLELYQAGNGQRKKHSHH